LRSGRIIQEEPPFFDEKMNEGVRYTLYVLLSNEDTICAAATPNGIGGISIVRVSGPNAFPLTDAVLSQRRPGSAYRGYTMHRAEVVDEDGIVDDVIVSIFRGPHSFSGEDVVEISCHGGPIPIARTIAALLKAGCRLAGPGEFTQRAFLNGKMDLLQAEAVCDLINARTQEAYRQAQSQKRGELSAVIESVRGQLLFILARIEASIDFSEDVGELDVRDCIGELKTAAVELVRLLGSADRGIMLRSGAQVVLVGRPNVGKSSIMNRLLRHDRAIVTDVPGTTRDTLEETATLRGVMVRIWDTAGIRTTFDPVESIGVERTHRAMETADLVVLVIDATVGETDDDRAIQRLVPSSRRLDVWNKADLTKAGNHCVSAKTGQGIEELEVAIGRKLLKGESSSDGSQAVVTHVHQRRAVEKALDAVREAIQTAEISLPADFLSINVRSALTALGEVTGQTATDDVISEIFAKFCIGK
jgi:tRNA modification GTPase